MEERSESFSEEREKRMDVFCVERRAAEDKAKIKIEEIRAEARRQAKEALGKVGVASKDEIGELKTLISTLTKKVDKLAKK